MILDSSKALDAMLAKQFLCGLLLNKNCKMTELANLQCRINTYHCPRI